MRYLLEDNPKSALSHLYHLAFNPAIISVDEIEFVGPNGEVKDRAKTDLEKTEEDIAVFIDLIVDNIDTVDCFRELWEIKKAYPTRIKVVPRICSEYYLLKSVENTPLVKDRELLNRCLYGRCHLQDIQWVQSKKGHTSYEQYCKHTVKRALLDCFRKKGKRDRFYISLDCLCNYPYNICTDKTLVEKAISYVELHKIFPKGSYIPSKSVVTDSSYEEYIAWFIRRHNKKVRDYMRLSPILIKELNRCLITTDRKGLPV